ncbi:hypothetical protein L218DRAFT_730064 [Marasmius fiardii PR-910]|nr:hypothetical protein L218DRAFT_730064 [Marasmius fiardii PR-910]
MEQGQSLLLCERCRSHWLLDSLSSNDTDLTDDYQLPELSEEEMVMKLEQHKADIALLRRKLKKLESAKQTLEARIRWRHHRVSALRNLPVQIWEKTFALACSFSSNDGYSLEITYSNSSKHTPPDPVFPIILSHVSSLWRTIALGFPRLWSSISIRFSGDIQLLGAKKLLESFLENSAVSVGSKSGGSERNSDLAETCPVFLGAPETSLYTIRQGGYRKLLQLQPFRVRPFPRCRFHRIRHIPSSIVLLLCRAKSTEIRTQRFMAGFTHCPEVGTGTGV